MKSKAMVVTAPGQMELQEFELPKTPADHVLVKTTVTSVCSTDIKIFKGHTPVGRYPLVMGHEATAEVVEIGSEVSAVSPGDRVAIFPLEYNEQGRVLIGMDVPGAYAEYATWSASNLHPLPDHLSYEAGALAEPLAVAVHA